MNIDEIEKVVRMLAGCKGRTVKGRNVGTLLSDGMSNQELLVARASSGWRELVNKLKADGLLLTKASVKRIDKEDGNGSIK